MSKDKEEKYDLGSLVREIAKLQVENDRLRREVKKLKQELEREKRSSGPYGGGQIVF